MQQAQLGEQRLDDVGIELASGLAAKLTGGGVVIATRPDAGNRQVVDGLQGVGRADSVIFRIRL